MPRRRADHHSVQQNAYHQPAPSHQVTSHQQQQQQQQQLRPDPQVQRSQGVIFLSSNKPQPVAQPPPPPAPSLQAHTAHLSHQVNQVPAHHASMFQPQHMPSYQTLMQNTLNPFFPYYHPLQQPVTTAPTSNDVYTPNGAGISYDNSMQVPPSPIRSKPKRRSRYTADSSSSSSEAEFNDDEEDPDWDPTGGGGGVPEEPPEPIFESRRGATRGRRASSTPRGRGRGRGSRGGGRGRGRGGRGRVSDAGIYHTDAPPNLIDQSAQIQNNLQLQGRQTRSAISMPSLDPQSGQMSFGELVSAAVQSLNETGEEYSAALQKKKKRLLAAAITTETNRVVRVERVEISTPGTMFIPVDTSQQVNDEENTDEMSLDYEEEDLIIAYEITLEEDRQRPFMCEICGSKTRSRVLHNRHLVTHAPNLPFACCICSQLFESTEKLKPHLRIHHGNGIFVCPELDCEGVFQERKSLDDHDFACHPNARPFPCRFCFDRFPSVADAQAHEDAHDEEITASCMKCSATYKTKTDLKNHYSHMHEEKTCKFCEKKFENQPALEEHQNEMHEEEMKPPPEPTPPPSPGLDDDPMHSPAGGDDEDDILVVEEHKKSTPGSSNRKNESRKSKGPGPAPKIKPISKERVPPPFSISKPAAKPKPIKPKPTTSKASSSDVITLSSDSDDDKDPEWKAPENLRSSRSPLKRSTRTSATRTSKKAEYIIVLESRDDQSASDVLKKPPQSNQPLTFVLGDSGDLVHVPTSSDPRPPDSLPIKEIMEVIKRQKLTDNTTIVIQDNKISSVKPSDSSRKSDKPSVLSRSNDASKESSEKRWVRPAPESSTNTKKKSESSAEIGRSSELHLKFKPSNNLVAKKRTGGLPRSDRSDKEKSSASSVTSATSEEKKSKPAGPIAKKRTGGSSRVYEEIKQKQSQSTVDVDRKKQSRKESHVVRLDDDDDDEPLIIEHSGLGPRPVGVTIPPRPQPPKVAVKNVSDHKSKKGKRGRKRGSSKSQRRQEKQKPKITEDYEESGGVSFTDYDNAPKRSLRIALKTSVTDSQGDESQADELDDPIGTDDYFGDEDYSSKKRGRPSVKTHSQPIASSSTANRGFNSLAESASTSATSNGQVVMKALVNGKWQDVVIGTKLANDNAGPTPPPPPVPSISRPSRVPAPPPPKPLNAKKSTSGSKKPPKPPAKPANRASGGAKRGRKTKNAPEPQRECWSDDRYQYFSGSNNTVDTSHMYPVPDEISYKNDDQADYSLNQSYENDADAVTPFSLSSLYMDYHQQEQNESGHLIDHDDSQEDQVPVILNAFHVESSDQPASYHQSYLDNSGGGVYKNEVNDMNPGMMDEGDDADEIPLHDPLAMDMDDDLPSQQEMVEEGDPLGCAEPDPLPPQPEQPAVVAEPKKGTVQEAKSAISNLRSVLSQITFKR